MCRFIYIHIFFALLFAFGYKKTVLYLFASHIIESIHFQCNFTERQHGEKKRETEYRALDFILDTCLSLFFAIRFCSACWVCDFSSAQPFSSSSSSLRVRNFIRLQFGSTYYSRMIYYLVYNFDLFALTFCALEKLRPKHTHTERKRETKTETEKDAYIEDKASVRFIWDGYVSLYSIS